MKLYYTLPHPELPAEEQYLIFAESEKEAESELEKFLARWGFLTPRFYPPQFIEVVGNKPGVIKLYSSLTPDVIS